MLLGCIISLLVAETLPGVLQTCLSFGIASENYYFMLFRVSNPFPEFNEWVGNHANDVVCWRGQAGWRRGSWGKPTSRDPAPLRAELYTQAMADARLLLASQIIKSSGSQGSDAIREQAADGPPCTTSVAPACASPGCFSSPASSCYYTKQIKSYKFSRAWHWGGHNYSYRS